jgi:hypothetical protein
MVAVMLYLPLSSYACRLYWTHSFFKWRKNGNCWSSCQFVCRRLTICLACPTSSHVNNILVTILPSCCDMNDNSFALVVATISASPVDSSLLTSLAHSKTLPAKPHDFYTALPLTLPYPIPCMPSTIPQASRPDVVHFAQHTIIA